MKVRELRELIANYHDEEEEVYLADSHWGASRLDVVREERYLGTGPLVVMLERER